MAHWRNFGNKSGMTDTVTETHAILALVAPRFKSAEQARIWFETEPLSGFAEATARQLVEAGRGRDVRNLIAAVDAGVYS